MKPDDLPRLPPEELMTFIIMHFRLQGYTLEEPQIAPAGQLLLFRLKVTLYVVDCPSNTPLFGPLLDVMSVEVAWAIKAAEILAAACGYVITRSRFFSKVS